MFRDTEFNEAIMCIFKFFFYIIWIITCFFMGFMHNSKNSGYH